MSENNTVCQHCGKSLKGIFRESLRKYCSRRCSCNATYKRKYPNRPHKLWVHEKGVFETAMEKYWSGEDGAEIARQLHIPVGTIYSWIHDFGEQKQRKEPLKKLLRLSQSADEWLSALRESTPPDNEFEESDICLVCETLQGQSVDKLVTVVMERLKDNPLNGRIYAFCNNTRNTITTLSWKEPVFNISKYVKMHGTFIWPQKSFGKSIAVTRAEFEHLISLQKQNANLSKTLDFMRIL